MKYIRSTFICGILLSLGALDMGFGICFASFTLTSISNDFGLGSGTSTLFNVAGFIGAVIAAIIMSIFVPKYGNRKCVFVSSFFAGVCWIILGVVKTSWGAFIFRLLTGSTIGMFSTTIPTFLAEIAPPERVFLYGFFSQVGIIGGFTTVTLCGFVFSWRTTAMLCSIPGFILFLTSLFIDDKFDPGAPQKRVPISAVIKQPRKAVISFLYMFFMQFSGINAVSSNMEIILNKANLGISTGAIGILATLSNVLTTMGASLFIDKLGNEICWKVSSVGQIVAFMMLFLHQMCHIGAWFFIIGLFLDNIMFGFGVGPIPFAAVADLYDDETRPSAMSVATAENWVLAAIVCTIWPIIQNSIGLGYSFLFFAVIQLCSFIFGVLVFYKQYVEPEVDDKVADQDLADLNKSLV